MKLSDTESRMKGLSHRYIWCEQLNIRILVYLLLHEVLLHWNDNTTFGKKINACDALIKDR